MSGLRGVVRRVGHRHEPAVRNSSQGDGEDVGRALGLGTWDCGFGAVCDSSVMELLVWFLMSL
ncbi:MAG: hypothetical protein GY755_14080 [Chloroflexi bacterium]|nr:hypothetical protein [Chloroflexota bacterium]